MVHKKKSDSSGGLVKMLLHFAIFLPTLYHLVGKMAILAKYEARLAGKSLIKIIIIAIISGIVLASTWLCLLAMYGLYLASLGINYTFIFSIIIAINLIVLVILGLIIKGAEKHLLFRATREQIRQVLKKT